ncbi:MAG: hypothetical protein ACM3OB_07805 [Acidobacteriota bacterium]
MTRKPRWSLALLSVVLLAPEAAARGQAAGDMTVKRLLGDTLQIMVPSTFTQMSEAGRLRYERSRRPTIAFTDKSGAVSIAITQVEQGQLSDAQVETAHKNMIGTLREAFPSAQWHRNDRREISGGHPAFLMDFDAPTTPTAPAARYVILGSALGGKLLTITLKCPPEQAATWLPVWDTLVQSVTYVE